MRALLLVIAALLLTVAPARADDVLRWWSNPLAAPLSSGTEIRIVSGAPQVTGMPSIAAPVPSARITPRVAPVIDPPPKVVIRPIYLPRTYVRPTPRPRTR
jgi:hypothetical protein